MAQERAAGSRGWERHPIAFGPLTKQGEGSPRSGDGTSREPESIPSDGVRRKGKKDAAPAATKQATQGKGLEGAKRRADTEKREEEEEKQTGDKMH